MRYSILRILICITILFFGTIERVFASDMAAFSSGRVNFSVKFKNELSPYSVIGVFLLPGESVTFEVIDALVGATFSFRKTAGVVKRQGGKRWKFTAPKSPGLFPAYIVSGGESSTLNILVMTPGKHKRDGMVNGYRIGKYPSAPSRKSEIYKRPKGFIEVTRDNEETLLSPHFKLKQFVCKQEGDYPKYVVLNERLILKLQLILERVNEKGIYANTFHVMSGYRTPYYNRAIGNVHASRHIFGDAADIFVDMKDPGGMMDDLNKDGKIDGADAAILYDIIDELDHEPSFKPFTGGLGLYPEAAHRGPFVHVDARGTCARWGR